MKYCSKCGAESADEAKFCPRCGEGFAEEAPAPETTAPAPDTITFDNSEAGQATYVDPATMPAAETKNNALLWLILNIVVTVLCCCLGGGLLSIIGIIFSAIAMSKYKAGDIEGGKKNEKVAMIMFFVALGLSILLFIVGMISGVLSGVLSDYSSFDFYY